MQDHITGQQHWHAGHNVAGYLPESDDPCTYAEWSDALSALVSDLESAWDDGDDGEYLPAHCDMHNATSGREFLTYTLPDREHALPTAWWLTECSETDCMTGEEWQS